ncbi:MAG: TetR/AcrR family transcriptional regulator [Nitrospirota bacterium]
MNKRSGIESKKKIMQAAMDVFSRKGYAKTSIREIAKTAGISIGGVYLYFNTKEELYRNLIHDKRREMAAMIERTVSEAESASGALSKFLELYLEYALKHKEFILLHIREHGFAFGIREKRNFFRKQRELIENIIAHGIRSGEFRECNPEAMATILVGALRGVVLSLALDADVRVTPIMLNEFVLEGLLSSRKGRDVSVHSGRSAKYPQREGQG